eukprot:433964-Pleurochrysis_carterae.AAC.1
MVLKASRRVTRDAFGSPSGALAAGLRSDSVLCPPVLTVSSNVSVLDVLGVLCSAATAAALSACRRLMSAERDVSSSPAPAPRPAREDRGERRRGGGASGDGAGGSSRAASALNACAASVALAAVLAAMPSSARSAQAPRSTSAAPAEPN